MKLTLKHHQAVWETTTVEVEVPSIDYAIAHADELIGQAISDGTAEIACGDHVESVDSDIEILDEQRI